VIDDVLHLVATKGVLVDPERQQTEGKRVVEIRPGRDCAGSRKGIVQETLEKGKRIARIPGQVAVHA
jgi:hypothetical protein